MSKLPTGDRVFVLGDSRTGTTSLHSLFKALGLKAIHYYVDEPGLLKPIHQFHDENWKLLKQYYSTCGYQAFSDYPTRLFYKEIYDLYPDAYFILSMRKDTDVWRRSMERYFSERGEGLQLDRLTNIYLEMNKKIEDFFTERGVDRFLKIVIDDGSDNGSRIKEFLGLTSSATLMRLNASSLRVSGDNGDEETAEERPRKFGKHSSVIQAALNDLYFDGVGDKAAYVKEKYFPGVTIGSALELGGGAGDFAIHVMNTMGCQDLTVYNDSSYSVEMGNKRVADKGLPIRFEQANLNDVKLNPSSFDLIYASHSLRHIDELENLFDQVNQALTPGGVFFCVDYVGPNYMQWTDSQLGIINDLLAVFPDEYAINNLRGDIVDKEVRRIPIETFTNTNSGSGFRSEDICGLLEEHLRVVETRPLGETLLYELLRGRIHNFDDTDPKDAFVLRLLAVFEKIMIESNVINSDFCFMVAKKKASKPIE